MRNAFQPALVAAILLATAATVVAQRRDYLTEAEIELVRDNQRIDLRVDVLSKAVSRRLSIIEGTVPSLKFGAEWGDPPNGSRSELLRDIDLLIGKAISDIDDVASRKAESEFFPKAVRRLASDCGIFLPRLERLTVSFTDERDKGSLVGSSGQCKDVISAARTLPDDPQKKKTKSR